MAHAYWRINVTRAISTVAGIADWAMFDGTGTPIATTGGTASASSSFGSLLPANAFDSNQATYWLSNGAYPQWLQYQFASPVDVVSFSLTSPATGSFNDYKTPIDFSLRYSDDGSTWTTVYNYM